MTRPIRCCRNLVFALSLAIVVLFAAAPPAFACACCTQAGQRNVATVTLDSGKRQEIESLRFAGKATLFAGEGDAADAPAPSIFRTGRW